MPQSGTGIVPAAGGTYAQLNATTRRAFIPAVVVQIYQAYPTLALMMRNAQRAAGGLSQVTVPAQSQSFVTPAFMGYDGNFAQPTDVQAIQNLEFNLCMLGTPVGFMGAEALIQETEAVIPLLKAKMADIKTATASTMASQLFTTTNTSDINPLAPNSLPQIYDDGTAFNNYGGLTRTAQPWLKAQKVNVGAAPTRQNMIAYLVQCSAASPAGATNNAGGEMPDFVVMSPNDWTTLMQDYMNIEQFHTSPNSKYGKDSVVNAGFRGIMLGDTPVFSDVFCPVGTAFMMNTRYIAMYMSEYAQFTFSGFQNAIANLQLAYIGIMLALYQIVCTKPVSGMQLRGITGAAF